MYYLFCGGECMNQWFWVKFRTVLSILVILVLFVSSINPVEVQAAVYNGEELPISISELINQAKKASNNKYFVIFYEGFRNGRLEMSSFDASGDFRVIWNEGIDPSYYDGEICQYYFNSENIFEQIGTYSRITDCAENIVASNVDIFDNSGNIVFKANAKVDDKLTDENDEKKEQKFIEVHKNYVGDNENNSYHHLLNYCDLSNIALRDYSELKGTYDTWRLIRGSIFDNPYEIALAELIISEESVDGQLDSFELNLYSKQRSIINNVMKLINGKVNLTEEQKSKFKELFTERNFDDETYKLCEDILGKYVSEDELKSLFQVYDTSNKFMGVLGDGEKIVDSVIDVINYSSILQAYDETSAEFKKVLTLVNYYCQGENSELDYAITQYLSIGDRSDINNQIIKRVVGNSVDVGMDLYEETILSKVRSFMINNMDLSNVAEATATKILAVIEGVKIGYSLGTTIDNILFNTDNVTDAYITAYASCKLAYYMKYALDDYAMALSENQTIENAELFCEAFSMYRHMQINVAANMIKYFATNKQSLIDKLFKSSAYEAAIYQWQILKLNWDNAKCHDGNISYKNTKTLTIACPVDIEIKDSSNSIVLKVVNNSVTYITEKAVATVRNNIKYITVFDDDYSLNIRATDTGKMSYRVTNYDNLEPQESVNFENIQLKSNNEYTGIITEGEGLSDNENALVLNGKIVESTVTTFDKENKVQICEIIFLNRDLELTVGNTAIVQVEILPVTASVKTVTWFSSNNNIVSVDEYGQIKALSVGSATVYCTTLDGRVTAECKIVVNSATATTESPNVVPKVSPADLPIKNSNNNSLLIGTTIKGATGETYKVLTENTVAYVKPARKSIKTAVVPSTISAKRRTFVVTSISSNAFSGCKKLRSISIGRNISSIGNRAFYSCKGVSKIIIPVKVVKIGKHAFANCKKLKRIIIKSTKLTNKSVGIKAFKGIYKKTIVKVPKKKKKMYKKLLVAKGMPKKIVIK